MVAQEIQVLGACIGIGVPLIGGLWLYSRYQRHKYARRMARNRSSQLSEIGKPSPTTEERIKKGEIVPHNSPATQRGRSSKRASHEGRGSERESVNYQVDTESGIDLGLSESGRYQEWRPSTAQQEEWIRQGAEQYRKEQQEKAKAEAAAELKQSKTI